MAQIDNTAIIDALNKPGMDIMQAILKDQEFDFLCFIQQNPEKLQAVLGRYSKEGVERDNSFSMCCVKALFAGAKEMWEIGKKEISLLNHRLIDEAFDKLYKGMESYTYKVNVMKWDMGGDHDAAMRRELSEVFDNCMDDFYEFVGEDHEYKYNPNFRIRPGEKWGSMEYLGYNPEYLFHEEHGAIAVRRIMMFDTLFNRFWKDDPAYMPSRPIVNTCVELVAALTCRVFLPVKHFFRRHTDHFKAEQIYKNACQTFDRSRIMGERSYTTGVNNVWRNVDFSKTYPFRSYVGDVYSKSAYKRTEWEKGIEAKLFKERKRKQQLHDLRTKGFPVIAVVLLALCFFTGLMGLTGNAQGITFLICWGGSFLLTWLSGLEDRSFLHSLVIWLIEVIAVVIILAVIDYFTQWGIFADFTG